MSTSHTIHNTTQVDFPTNHLLSKISQTNTPNRNAITLSSVVVVGDKRHLGDNSRILLVADFHLDFSTGLVETLLDVTHGDGLLQGRRKSTGGDFTNLFAIGKDLGTVTSRSALDEEAHTLLIAGGHLFDQQSLPLLHAP